LWDVVTHRATSMSGNTLSTRMYERTPAYEHSTDTNHDDLNGTTKRAHGGQLILTTKRRGSVLWIFASKDHISL
jgi:hypothetical protein